jgi:hypothetical protein
MLAAIRRPTRREGLGELTAVSMVPIANATP